MLLNGNQKITDDEMLRFLFNTFVFLKVAVSFLIFKLGYISKMLHMG